MGWPKAGLGLYAEAHVCSGIPVETGLVDMSMFLVIAVVPPSDLLVKLQRTLGRPPNGWDHSQGGPGSAFPRLAASDTIHIVTYKEVIVSSCSLKPESIHNLRATSL